MKPKRKAEILANETVGMIVSKIRISRGSYGEKRCGWLCIEFKGNAMLTVPLLCNSWSTQKLWSKKAK
jgi:hypothetical protein